MLVPILAALVIGLLFIIYNLNNIIELIRYKRLIYRLPGPKRYPFIGNVLDLVVDDDTLFKTVRKWSQEYYPVYNLSAGMHTSANISGPEDFLAVASTTKNIQKGTTYGVLDLWLGEGLLTSTGAKWHTRRKILTPAFHLSVLQQFAPIFNAETENLVEILKKECRKPYINVIPYISQFALSTINETSMGTKLDLENEEDKEYCSATHQVGKLFYRRVMRPWLYSHLVYYNFTPVGYKEKKLVKLLHNFTNKVIKNKSQHFEKFEIPDDEEYNYSTRKKMAMLDLLLNARFGNDAIIDDQGIQDEVNTFMFEGHDTVATSISYTLMLLASHQDVQEKILQEIYQVCGKSDSQPTFKDLQELKYMERCIKESLRLYPSVPYIARILEEDVATSNGYIIPKGTVTNIHIFDIHRIPKIWPDPEKFDPDRFLPENCQNRHPFAYVPFSAGPRNCIGQKFALLELKAVLCGILRNFVLEPVDTPDTIVLVIDMILRTENDIIRVKFTPRK